MFWGGEGWQHVIKTIDNAKPLEDTVETLLKGDFTNNKLTCDSYIEVTLLKPNRRTVRYFDITLFKSIAHLVGEKEVSIIDGKLL